MTDQKSTNKAAASGKAQGKGFVHWAKVVALFVGQTILLVIGLAVIVSTAVEFFEGSFALAELSILEIIATFLLVSLTVRHVELSKAAGLKWRAIIYRPLRLIAWVMIVCLLLIVVIALVNPQDFEINFVKKSNLLQSLEIIFIQICLYFSPPKRKAVDEPVIAAAESGSAQ